MVTVFPAEAGKGIAVAVMRWFVLAMLLMSAVAAPDLAAQDRSSFQNPAEYASYMAALNTRDPAKRAAAMEVFAAWYPGSAVRLEAYEHAMTAWQAAGQPDKADVIAGKLLQADPDHVHSLATRVYAGRIRAGQGGQAALRKLVPTAAHG